MQIQTQINRLLRCAMLLGSLAATSCVDDYYSKKQTEQSDQSLTLDILLRTPSTGSSKQSRAATTEEQEAAEAAETRIEDVSVLFFRNSTGRLYAVKSGTGIERPNPDSDKSRWTFRTSLTVESSMANERFDCYVVANAGDISGLLASYITYEEARAALVGTVPGKLHTDHATDNFTMWGKTDLQFDATTQNQRLSVALLRDVARVDVQVAETTPAIPFEMKEVYIFKPNDKIGQMPLLDALGSDNTGNAAVTKPSIPAGTSVQAENWAYTAITGNKIDYTVYIPEADVVMGGTGASGDQNHTNRCALVVGGSFKGDAQTTYYRIDFKKTIQQNGQNKQVLADILRNHRYIIHITAVDGPGEATPGEAYKSVSADISAEITTWTDSNQDIVFDGVNWISIGRKHVELGSGKGVSAYVSLSSSIALDKWTMRLGETGEFSNAATVRGTHFSVTKPRQQEGSGLTITTLESLDDETVRSEKLYIRIGRMEIIVTLVQNPDTGAPWEEGGDFEWEL